MTETKKLKLGSLFDGIGGFPYAGSFLGIEPLWASEIMPSAISVTKRHLPNMAHVGDITKLNGAELPPVDIITFGSPCQGYAEETVIPKFKPLPLQIKGLRSKTSG